MLIIGLTGSMGMGKSTTANLFHEYNIPVYDADATVHKLYQSTAINPVRAVFPDVIDEHGVSRLLLKQHLTQFPDDIKKLEAIIHPLVRQAQFDWLQHHRDAGQSCVLLDIPLLFETGGDAFCDHIVVVTTSAEIQMERILSRGNMTKDQVEDLLSRQMSDADKCARADTIIDTSKSIEDARRQVKELLASLCLNLK